MHARNTTPPIVPPAIAPAGGLVVASASTAVGDGDGFEELETIADDDEGFEELEVGAGGGEVGLVEVDEVVGVPADGELLGQNLAP
jgi:hypothetical protein